MLSRTEIGKISGGCSTIAIWRRSDFRPNSRTSTPSIETLPSDGSKKRGSSPSRVDFPAPVGPTIAIFMPGSTLRSIDRSTGISER